MKSWLSVFLPKDEYKERQMLHFIAEAAIVQFILILSIFIVNQVFFSIESGIILVICMFTTIFYVGARYIFSGIEYTDVSTEQEYKHHVSEIRKKSLGFTIIYFLLAVLFDVTSVTSFFIGGFEFFIFLAIFILFLFSIQYISLRKSYNKNRKLL